MNLPSVWAQFGLNFARSLKSSMSESMASASARRCLLLFPVRDAGMRTRISVRIGEEVPTLSYVTLTGPETGHCVRRAFMCAYPYPKI